MTGAVFMAQTFFFALAWLIGVPGAFVHPMANPSVYLRSLALLNAVALMLAFVAAVLGIGGVGWVLFFGSVGYSLASDVNAVAKRVRYQRAVWRFKKEVGR